MAKRKVNKSQIIRDMIKANPEMKPAEVVTAMEKDGHKISVNLVYLVKGATKERTKRKSKIAKAAMAATAGNTVGNVVVAKTDAITMIREVKALAEKAGGYGKLMELIEALAG